MQQILQILQQNLNEIERDKDFALLKRHLKNQFIKKIAKLLAKRRRVMGNI